MRYTPTEILPGIGSSTPGRHCPGFESTLPLEALDELLRRRAHAKALKRRTLPPGRELGRLPRALEAVVSPASRAAMTRRFTAFAVFLALLLASAAPGQEAIVSAQIVGITDGDTVKALAAGNELLRVRLSWIDAPEKSQALG
jgi:endonuclease YncB( thermonuclease family)